MRRKLFCDIDGTVTDHSQRIRRWTLPSWPGNAIHPNAFSEEEVMGDKPAFASQEALAKLSEEYDIHWITTRPAHLETVTLLWLQKHNYPVVSLTLVGNLKDKPAILKREGAALYVDDLMTDHEKAKTKLRADVVKELKKLKVKYEIFDPVSNNWSDIVKKYRGSEGK